MRIPFWRLTRDAQPARGVAFAAGLTVLFAASIAGAIHWTCNHQGVATIWPASGLMVAAILLLPRRLVGPTVLACFAADLAIKAALGAGIERNVDYAVFGLLEAGLVALLTRRLCGAALNMVRPVRFFRFILVAVVPSVAVITAAGSALFAFRFGQPFLATWWGWFSADSLGLILTVPMTLLAVRPRRYARDCAAGPVERAVLLGAVALAAALVFSQEVMPVIFLQFPLLLLLTIRLGPTWTSVALSLIAAIAVPFTLAGHGPLNMLPGVEAARRALILQFYLTAMLVSMLPAASFLADRRRDREALALKVREARAAKAAAESATRAKTQFLAVMSHEIRTPLNGLLGFVQIIGRREDLPADLRRQVEMMGGSCDVLLSLVNDVLDLSRLEAGRIELAPRPFALADVLTGAADLVRGTAEAKGLDLALDLDEIEGLRHIGDDSRLAQVALNLIGNAVKFTSIGEVRLSVDRREDDEGDVLTVRVTDTGVGVPANRVDRLFQVFSQVDSTTAREFGGSGLGLAISRRLIEVMDGAIGYRPAETGGSEFWFEVTLPRAEAAPKAEAAAESDVAGLKVLVVDDHPVNREVASLMLIAAGCLVSTRSDGSGAVEALKNESFDLVFMDVHMPGMDGLAATAAIRALGGAAARTPIVAMTADTASADVEACVKAGMDGHLPKPIRREKLIEALALYAPGADEAEAVKAA